MKKYESKYVVGQVMDAIGVKISKKSKSSNNGEIYKNIASLLNNVPMCYSKGKILDYSILYFRLSEIVDLISKDTSDDTFNKKYNKALSSFLKGDPNINMKKDEALLRLIPLRYSLEYNSKNDYNPVNMSIINLKNKVEDLIKHIVYLDSYKYDNITYLKNIINEIDQIDLDTVYKTGVDPMTLMGLNI